MNILVTGSDGLIGWHMRCFLHCREGVEVLACNRQQFEDDDYLSKMLQKADAVVHLAGANRGNPDDVARSNLQIANRLVSLLQKSSSTPQLLFSNSIHAELDTPYGQSKRDSSEIYRQWAGDVGSCYCDIMLPHVFGEHSKPFYNTVVATFAHQLVTGDTPKIETDGELNLLHAQDVAQIFWDQIEAQSNTKLRPAGRQMLVSELLTRLQSMHERYAGGVVPKLDEAIDTQLFNTLRSMIPHEQRPVDLTLHTDERGSLFEAIRADGGGQVFLSSTKPGITRGNHFHTRKVERFLVVKGTAEISIRRVLTSDIHTFKVDGRHPQAIDIPTLHTHNITNTGDEELQTLFWSNELFDPENPDTYYEVV